MTAANIRAIDLYCGAGGLSRGMQEAGIEVVAGVDLDSKCSFPYEHNLGAKFVEADVADLGSDDLNKFWGDAELRLLAGCAPCQPFSTHRRGSDTSEDSRWSLLDHFGRMIDESRPDLVTMENVAGLRRSEVYERFVELLRESGYHCDAQLVNCAAFGLPQFRRRLVLVASTLGPIEVPSGSHSRTNYVSVRDTIGSLAALEPGQTDDTDALHRARKLSDLNLRRIRASTPGGTWREWPEELRAPCHKKASGASFKSVYARMKWDDPSPTITTQSHNFGTGRFGHPEQDRAISLREAALLQGFDHNYRFTPPDISPDFSNVGRLIGNAVPPPLAAAIGGAFVEHVEATIVPQGSSREAT